MESKHNSEFIALYNFTPKQTQLLDKNGYEALKNHGWVYPFVKLHQYDFILPNRITYLVELGSASLEDLKCLFTATLFFVWKKLFYFCPPLY